MYRHQETLYQLPWHQKDNPNGWIEPTTVCQLKCPGCYRGCDQPDRPQVHRDLFSLQEEIDWHIDQRNIQTLSIAGGEPLLFPHLDTLVQYAYDRKLKVKIFTNGLLLNEERLRQLQSCGVTECVIHIDKFQRGKESEEELMKERWQHCKTFRKVGGINLGFIQPLSSANLDDLASLSSFYQQNSDIVHLVVFTVFKEMMPNKTIDSSLVVSMDEIMDKVKSAFGLQYCAYLDKIHSKDISWLFALSAFHRGALLGSYDGTFYRYLQERYHQKNGRYFFTVRNRPLQPWKLLFRLWNTSVRKILWRCIPHMLSPIYHQVVLIINPPSQINGQWDICSACPDAMLHEGKLVPSCLLERIRHGERICV